MLARNLIGFLVVGVIVCAGAKAVSAEESTGAAVNNGVAMSCKLTNGSGHCRIENTLKVKRGCAFTIKLRDRHGEKSISGGKTLGPGVIGQYRFRGNWHHKIAQVTLSCTGP